MPRLQFAAISGGGRKSGSGGGERAVAYFDEDSVTMAVAAATDCLRGIDRNEVDGLFFASTTYPFKEKSGASLIAKALDLRRDVLATDVSSSVRAGTAALRAALDAVRAGSAHQVLVVASDCRIGAPRSALERNFGDGAAAFLVAADGTFASIEHFTTIADEIIDVWRRDEDTFVKQWEDRFVVEHGYADNVREVVKRLFERSGLAAKDFQRLVLYGPDARSIEGVAKRLGFDPRANLEDPLFGRLGNVGAAFAPILLAAALEKAKPGERLLVANYGDGADAFAVNITGTPSHAAGRRGVSWHLQRRSELDSYDKFLSFRHLQATDQDRRAGAGVSATVHYRDRNEDISLHGHRCRTCGTLQYPFQRVCFQCFAKDDFDEVRLADLTGKVLSFTMDFFAGSPDPPLVVTMIETEGGARLHMQMTDVSPRELKLDLPVEFVFRKIHEYGGTPNYYWKCTPIR
jgi:3-hydroxy-3-methylglutaryl CoA synthase